MNILHIIPSLDCTGAAAQLGMLTKRLSSLHQLRICCLGGDGPGAARLRADGQRVDCLRWTRTFDPAAWWNLRDVLKSSSPDLIHVWGLAALRTLALAGRHWLRRTLVSGPLPHDAKQLNRIDRWLLRNVRLVAASSIAEAAACKQLGLADQQLAIVPPGVEVPPDNSSAWHPNRGIMCIGPLEPRKDFRNAIWALGILGYVFDDARLTLVGGGSQRPYLEWFVKSLQMTECVQFLGWRDDVSQLLSGANVCWAPAIGSRQAMLEAMAAGCPVVAADHPAQREIVTDGETGYLVPPGDRIELCKRTRALFLDDELARTMGEAARRRVGQRFSAAACAERWDQQYAAAASKSRAS